MSDEVKKQLDRILKKQETLLRKHADNPNEVAFICGTWSGFLAGMKLTGAITFQEYNMLYDKFLRKIESKKYA